MPYRYGSEMRKYLPDFIVLVDVTATVAMIHCIWWSRLRVTDGRTRKEKKSTMDTYWVPGVNHLTT